MFGAHRENYGTLFGTLKFNQAEPILYLVVGKHFKVDNRADSGEKPSKSAPGKLHSTSSV